MLLREVDKSDVSMLEAALVLSIQYTHLPF